MRKQRSTSEFAPGWRDRLRECLGSLFFCALWAVGIATAAEPVPELTALLVDQAGALSENERAVITARLRAIQESGRA